MKNLEKMTDDEVFAAQKYVDLLMDGTPVSDPIGLAAMQMNAGLLLELVNRGYVTHCENGEYVGWKHVSQLK